MLIESHQPKMAWSPADLCVCVFGRVCDLLLKLLSETVWPVGSFQDVLEFRLCSSSVRPAARSRSSTNEFFVFVDDEALRAHDGRDCATGPACCSLVKSFANTAARKVPDKSAKR
jgi:hypothetical protein